MKILITGSSGFVGTHLVNKLSKNHKIIKYDLKKGQDVLNKKILFDKLKGVDIVIHLASYISAPESWIDPEGYITNNTLGTLSVIKTMIKANVKKLIFFSSAAAKVKPQTPYGISKFAAEEVIKLYSKELDVTIVRPENIYGPGQKESYGYVIHNFIKSIKSGKSVTIYGDGLQKRDFIYISDVVDSVEFIIKKNIWNKTLSLGTGKSVNVLSLAKSTAKILRKKLVIFHGEKRIEPRASAAKIETLKSVGINYKKFKSLTSGIKKLIQIEYLH